MEEKKQQSSEEGENKDLEPRTTDKGE